MNRNQFIITLVLISANLNACYMHVMDEDHTSSESKPIAQENEAVAIQIVSRQEAEQECLTIADAAQNIDAITLTFEITRQPEYDEERWQELVARSIACCKLFVATEDEELIGKIHDETADFVRFLFYNSDADKGIDSMFAIKLSEPDEKNPEAEKLIVLMNETSTPDDQEAERLLESMGKTKTKIPGVYLSDPRIIPSSK